MTTPTPDREALEALADRCEKAEGPDRELDERCFGVHYGWDWPLFGASAREYADVGFPSYTASIDAAMTLIPERYRLGTLLEFDSNGWWAAKLFNRGPPGGLPSCGAASPALALTAACLRALAGDRP